MKRNKKILLIVIASILGTIVLLAALVGILEWRENQKAASMNEDAEIDYPFYTADFNLNIYEDEEYQELMRGRFLSYCDSYTNVTVTLTRDTASKYGTDVEFLVNYIYTIIEGDHEAYNACFSDRYYGQGKNRKEDFTMQQLHHIVLTKVSSETISEDGSNYTKSIYIVEYQINENNGTFRRDIGDGSKPQYFEITNRSGEWLIDSIATPTAKIPS